MKKSLLPLLLVLPFPLYAATDFQKFALEDTLKCAHPTVSADTAKVEIVNPATQTGDKETARVKIYYKGLIHNNSMLVDYTVIHASTSFIHAAVLEDPSTPKPCAYFSGWQEMK